MVGNYIGDEKLKEKLQTAFFQHIKSIRRIDYLHHAQFYIVYVNNLSGKMVETMHARMKSFIPYVGYFDLTYSSFIKTYLSTILVKLCLKCKTTIIAGHADDQNNDRDENVSGYPFEENGYNCKSIQSSYFDLFLSYKIEREVFEGFENDTAFAINAICKNVLDISDFTLLIEDEKLGYLLRAKEANLKRAGIINLTHKELEQFVQKKISNNYIYNLTFLSEHGTIKFNIMLETKTKDTNEFVRLNAALEYKPIDRTLRLITMY